MNLNLNDNRSPTPYPDVNQVLDILLKNVQVILNGYFVGMYLYGSLASGDFDPGRSDIDFLVVTKEELPDDIVTGLKSMHTRLYKSGMEWAPKLEGSYVPTDVIRRYSVNGPSWPMINKDKFLVAHENISWVINNYVLSKSGVVITGPPLQTIIKPISKEELKGAVLTLLRDVWTPWQYNSDLFHSDEYQSYVVLTMCRAIYTLKNRTVVSKRRSAEWAIKNLDRKWMELIKLALAWHHGDPPGDIE